MWTSMMLGFEGTNAVLFCRATGNPPPTVTWFDPYDHHITSSSNHNQYLASIMIWAYRALCATTPLESTVQSCKPFCEWVCVYGLTSQLTHNSPWLTDLHLSHLPSSLALSSHSRFRTPMFTNPTHCHPSINRRIREVYRLFRFLTVAGIYSASHC